MRKDTMSSLLDGIQAALPEPVTTPMVAGAFAAIVTINLVIRSRSFKRDGSESFSDLVTGSVNILSNKDSVLQRDQVSKSMAEYDELFEGARKNVGSLHKEESIKKREKEYKTMVNNFYDLVTDFYEWGWGQVSRVVVVIGCARRKQYYRYVARARERRNGTQIVIRRHLVVVSRPATCLDVNAFIQLEWVHRILLILDVAAFLSAHLVSFFFNSHHPSAAFPSSLLTTFSFPVLPLCSPCQGRDLYGIYQQS